MTSLGDENRDMLILWVASPLNVPVFDGADDVRLVHGAELDFDFVAGACFGIRQQQIKAPGPGLPALAVAHVEVSEPEQRWVGDEMVMQPAFGDTGMVLEAQMLGLVQVHESLLIPEKGLT